MPPLAPMKKKMAMPPASLLARHTSRLNVHAQQHELRHALGDYSNNITMGSNTRLLTWHPGSLTYLG
jgi:hypothetical protein